MTDQLVGVRRIAAALGVDRSTIHRRIARGELVPALIVEGRPYFTSDDLERFKAARTPVVEPDRFIETRS